MPRAVSLLSPIFCCGRTLPLAATGPPSSLRTTASPHVISRVRYHWPSNILAHVPCFSLLQDAFPPFHPPQELWPWQPHVPQVRQRARSYSQVLVWPTASAPLSAVIVHSRSQHRSTICLNLTLHSYRRSPFIPLADHMMLCRRCFRENAGAIGFHKVCSHIANIISARGDCDDEVC